MRGCTGCWPAWTYQSCLPRPSWSPEELVSWWGNADAENLLIYLIIKPNHARKICCCCCVFWTDKDWHMPLFSHTIILSSVSSIALYIKLYEKVITACFCAGCWWVLGSWCPQHSEGDEGGQLQTSAQDVCLWSGSADIWGTSGSLIPTSKALIFSVTILCHINPKHNHEKWKRILNISTNSLPPKEEAF